MCCFVCIFLALDKVFRSDCSTRQVYEEGAKEVALLVVSGINGEYNFGFFIIISLSWNLLVTTHIYIIFNGNLLFSKYFCIWTNKQWKDVYHEWNYRVHSGRYLQLHGEGNWNINIDFPYLFLSIPYFSGGSINLIQWCEFLA